MEYAQRLEFAAAMQKRLKSLKKDVGAVRVYGGYKGTGSKAYRRQVWVDFPFGTADVWMRWDAVKVGSICDRHFCAVIDASDGDVERVYAALVAVFNGRAGA